MAKITFIGAGSLVFTRSLCNDILLTPSLKDFTVCLMDIDSVRLEQALQVVRTMAAAMKREVRIEATEDLDVAIRGARYVVTTFQQGGLEAYALDIEIPRRFGVEQCVGDTIGPGGVFRALRTIPVMQDICKRMDDLAPDSLLLNYVNPMAAVCRAVDRLSGRPHVGLCHSVQQTSEMLARWIDVPIGEVSFHCAGINHQAFFLAFRRNGKDLYPRIREAIQRPEIYGEEPVRIDLMKTFGYFVTESSGHASEYLPWFRKDADQIQRDLVPKFTDPVNHWFRFGETGGYLQFCRDREAQYTGEFRDTLNRLPDKERGFEYGSYIMEAIETDVPAVVYGNVPNRGVIDNLPRDACVEVPCLVDGAGVQPTVVGALPAQLAALNRTNINVQELIVEAAATGETEAIHQAVALDPMTGAVCTLEQVHAMVNEMLTAQKRWLPQFESG